MNGTANIRHDVTLVTEHDVYLFKEGNHFRLYEKLGSHPIDVKGVKGTFFAVWAPNAREVSVIGDFNGWNPNTHPLRVREDSSGIWEGFIPGVNSGTVYKYHIVSSHLGSRVDKGDPFAFTWESPPRTASVVWDLAYDWKDEKWMEERKKRNSLHSPLSIYEVHAGSWRRVPEEGMRSLNWNEMADMLPGYCRDLGFSHVEFLPVMEHPFYGSWGYQTTGYFAPTSRYGKPQGFMELVDALHREGIGVILDWVPSHFPSDEHGLVYFDGTHLFEHADPRQGFHPDWKSYIFNYGRNEVRSFLISSAMFWLENYHADGLRFDAVASMLYLDYSREQGEWVPNKYGGRENLEAISFLRRMNEVVYDSHSDIQTIAEESTDWPMVSRPVYLGGLGFGMKWNMGWMHDTLDYFSRDSIHRKFHHNQLTFSIWYAFSENFLLPLSHDEVVHEKGSLLNKMPGDEWQKFANLRLLLGYMFGHPGKKLLFMGSEFGQWREWNHDESLDWHLLEEPQHQGLHRFVRDLNHLYSRYEALYRRDFEIEGFQWVDFHDWEQSVISFLRRGENEDDLVLVTCNFTPIPRYNYRLIVPKEGRWEEILNSDAPLYGGSGVGNYGGVTTFPLPSRENGYSLTINLPPLGVVFFRLMGLEK